MIAGPPLSFSRGWVHDFRLFRVKGTFRFGQHKALALAGSPGPAI